jgi:predicted KAP-like P-loop ATPase
MDGRKFEEAKRRHAGFFHPPLIAGVADLPVDGSDGSTDQFDLPTQLAPYYHILRHPNTKTPLSLAIYGSWGTGKSSAMRWLKRSLDEWTDYIKDPSWDQTRFDEIQFAEFKRSLAKHPKLITVEFCPWKYKTDADLWRGILSEVILAILAAEQKEARGLGRLALSLKRIAPAIGSGLLNSVTAKVTTGPKGALGHLISLF